jgi:RNA polymerase sigma-70 factor (ECF subfamily)
VAQHETSIGTGDGTFRTTVWDDLAAAREDPRRLGDLIARYWRPVYRTLRHGWHASREEAKDLTQEFFSRLLEDGTFAQADPARGRFRAFLLGALRHFMLNVRRDAGRLKRGGGRAVLALEPAEEDERPIAAADGAPSPERLFERAWAQQMLDEAIGRLRAELVSDGRERHWKVFEAYDLTDPPGTYAETAERLGLRESEVRNLLHEVRRRLNRILMRRILDYTETPEQAVEEFRSLFGGP